MERDYPQLGSIRSQAERREAQAGLERGADLGALVESLAHFFKRLRKPFALRTVLPHH